MTRLSREHYRYGFSSVGNMMQSGAVVHDCDFTKEIKLWLAYRRWKQRKQREKRQYRVHPILHDRMTQSMFLTLYPKLREHNKKFFNYFRMSVQSFDELLEIVKEDLSPCENYVVRDVVSAEEKLVITLRLVIRYKYINVFIGWYFK